jgi:hypothetical protein
MICQPCRDKAHDQCEDRPRATAAARGQIRDYLGRWCDCQHLPPLTETEYVTSRVDG